MTSLARTAGRLGGSIQAIVIVAAGIACSISVVFFAALLPALAVICGAIAFIFVVLRVDIGLYLIAFTNYLNLSDILIRNYDAPSIAKFTVAGLLVAVLLRWALFGVRFGGTVSTYMTIGAVWFFAVSSVFYADHPDASFDAAERLTKDILFAVIILMVVVEGKTLRRLVWSLILAGAVMAAITVYQSLTESFDNDFFGLGKADLHQIVGEVEGYRSTGPLDDPNMYAQVLLLLVPLAAERMINENKFLLRLVAGFGFMACTLAIIFTYSRGALLALFVVCVTLAISVIRRPKIALIVIVLLGAALPLVPASYIDRLQKIELPFSETSGSEEDESLEGRGAEMIVAWEMFLDHPLFGVGLENYPLHFQQYVQRLNLPARHENRKAHSLYLQLAAERGIVGISSFAGMLFVAMQSLFRGRRMLKGTGRHTEAGIAGAVAISLLGYGVAAIFLHGDYGRYFWIMIGIAMCVQSIAVRGAKPPWNKIWGNKL